LNSQSPDELLSTFANLDHSRVKRVGFPEAVYGQGKTPSQIHSILDSMANNVNDMIETAIESDGIVSTASTAIIATRIDKSVYDEVEKIGPLQNGTMQYYETAKLLSVRANALEDSDGNKRTDLIQSTIRKSVVVACAGTTDLHVAEEAALTLSLSGVQVTRIYDCGVAGLHRIISALPKLRDPDVGCVLVCAGMDGALPSVVGGLVDVPVVAVPTSVGYGISLGGISALLTMLNSCSPGVGVVNVDNGFGAAVWAIKCLR
jgi:NCAIR mutase (PurE)-related protein